jgi:hypothetical protein
MPALTPQPPLPILGEREINPLPPILGEGLGVRASHPDEEGNPAIALASLHSRAFPPGRGRR